jgi:hypothetical protein
MAQITVQVEEENLTTVSTNLNNPVVLETLDNVGDIDMSANGKQDGSVLVYKTNTNKWTATTLLDQQEISAGQF